MACKMQEANYPAEAGQNESERNEMNNLFLAMYLKLQNLINREEGQDLVEYALIISIIALALITISGKLATAISTVFTNISNSLV